MNCTDSIQRMPLHHAGNSDLTSFSRVKVTAFLAALMKLQLYSLYAALSGCLSCTEILWDFKADLDAQDEVGWTIY